MSRSKWYWTLQIAGWTFYGIVGALITVLFMKDQGVNVGFHFFAAALMLLSTHSIRFFFKRGKWLELGIWKFMLRVFPLVIICALLINVVNTFYYMYFTDLFGPEEFSVLVLLVYVFQSTIYFSLWIGIYLVIHYFRNYKSEEIEKWKLQASLKDAELIALKAQINPHFLFNALNNIRALILEDSIKAREMVSHLSELLRYSIQFNSNERVSLEEELDIVEKYLSLESIHYEHRLKYEIDVRKDLLNCKIPPMLMQLMVENAVKHGISQVSKGGVINPRVSRSNDDLCIEVWNTGRLRNSERDGIGIRNATERIRLMFDEEPDFELTQEGDMVKSKLKLPIVV